MQGDRQVQGYEQAHHAMRAATGLAVLELRQPLGCHFGSAGSLDLGEPQVTAAFAQRARRPTRGTHVKVHEIEIEIQMRS